MTAAQVDVRKFLDGLADRYAAVHRPVDYKPYDRRYPTPAHLAERLDPKWRRSPALDLINDALVELIDDPRAEALAVFLPAQEGKSELISRRFPEWVLDYDPSQRVAIISYEQDTAARWGREIKQDIAMSEGNLRIQVRRDSTAAARWQTPEGGGVYSVGVGGALTGRPVDCLRGDTPIMTETGYVNIRDIHEAARKPRVLSYNRGTGRTEWQPVTASRAIPNRRLIEVVSASGHRFTCTPDHRVAAQAGYKAAQELAPGDRLIAMRGLRGNVRPAGIRARQADAQRTDPVLLLAGMYRQRPSGAQPQGDLRSVRPVLHGQGPQVLLTGMPGACAAGTPTETLPAVRGAVHPQEQPHSLLRTGLRQLGALAADDRRGQLAFQGRHQLRGMVQADASADPRARQGVPGLPPAGPHRAPHQPRPKRLPSGQPDTALPDMSCGAPQVEDDAVAVVRELRGERDTVYDIQVAGNSNFFAGQVLVHNCLIIDDPVKDREHAESETIRNAAWNWWESVALTRLAPGAKVVLIMCMTGDTPVLMGDGEEKPLRDVRPGDTVATYEDGRLTTATVRNWASQGPDSVYAIRTRSGAVVKANARHPFLTVQAGREAWRRTDMLRPGSLIRRVTGGSGAEPPVTCEAEVDEVAEITPCGTEDVFDLQVDRTENFIANGLVSHNTRWHQDDLAGRILSRPSPLRWRTISLPAIATEDDPLGRAPGEELPSARGREPGHFLRLQETMTPYVFSSIYQQNPAPAEGNFFKRSRFQHWAWAEPWADGRERINLGGTVWTLEDCWRFMTMDVAASKKETADWTVVSMWCVTGLGDLVLLDRQRERVEQHDHFALAVPLVERFGPATLHVEKGFFSSTVAKDAVNAGWPVAPLDADTDKVTRAIPAAHRVYARKVWFPGHAGWLKVWEDELVTFPRASHDDQVDTLSYAGLILVTSWSGQTGGAPVERPDPAQQAIADAYRGATGNDGEVDLMTAQW